MPESTDPAAADVSIDAKPSDKADKTDKTDKPDAKSTKASKDAPVMRVRVSSPFKVFYDEEALALSGENASGPFDILPHHHNFISLLDECELVIKTRAGDTRIRISSGIMHVKADQVVVFLNV